MKKTENKLMNEINAKIGFYKKNFSDNPEILDNLVVIIPEDKYEILADMAVDYFMSIPTMTKARFDHIFGVPIEIANNISKIYVAVNLDYEQERLEYDRIKGM